jgi:hypothetical protein
MNIFALRNVNLLNSEGRMTSTYNIHRDFWIPQFLTFLALLRSLMDYFPGMMVLVDRLTLSVEYQDPRCKGWPGNSVVIFCHTRKELNYVLLLLC